MNQLLHKWQGKSETSEEPTTAVQEVSDTETAMDGRRENHVWKILGMANIYHKHAYFDFESTTQFFNFCSIKYRKCLGEAGQR